MSRIPQFPRNDDGLLHGAEPFSLGDGPVGCLLVHGFTSTPYDVRSCGEFLATAGITVEAVRLAGHGTRPEDLARTSLPDWLHSIRAGYDRLAERSEYVFGLGISLSGNFLLSLGTRLPFAGLILIGTPLRFRYDRAVRTASRLLRAVGKQYQRKWYHEYLDEQIRERRPTYDRFPLQCVPDCFRAIAWSRANLPHIRSPVLILQSTTDHAVDQRTIGEFYAHLGTKDINVEWFRDRYHVLLIDHGASEVFASIHRFIRSRTPAAVPAPETSPLRAQPAGSPA